MTEADWLACTDPRAMLDFVGPTASTRKLTLFSVAACRRIWHLLLDSRSRQLVEAVEHWADHPDEYSKVAAAYDAHDAAESAYDFKAPFHAACYACIAGLDAATQVSREAADAFAVSCWWLSAPEDMDVLDLATYAAFEALEEAATRYEQAAQCELIRDIIGIPFHAVALQADWLSPAVKEIATSIYDARRFAQLPAMADALEVAGCNSLTLLGHCRNGKNHVRGCWAIDTVLGRN